MKTPTKGMKSLRAWQEGIKADGVRNREVATDSSNFLTPSPKLCAALGSIVVHVNEMLSDNGHAFDRIALQGLLEDPDVELWISHGRALAMVPEKRRKS